MVVKQSKHQLYVEAKSVGSRFMSVSCYYSVDTRFLCIVRIACLIFSTFYYTTSTPDIVTCHGIVMGLNTYLVIIARSFGRVL